MAVKIAGRIVYSIITILIIGAVVIYLGRPCNSEIPEEDINKFIKVYTELSIAKETFIHNKDTVFAKYDAIYEDFGVDSTWIDQFISNLEEQPDIQKMVWTKIVANLDSLRENVSPDTVKIL